MCRELDGRVMVALTASPSISSHHTLRLHHHHRCCCCCCSCRLVLGRITISPFGRERMDIGIRAHTQTHTHKAKKRTDEQTNERINQRRTTTTTRSTAAISFLNHKKIPSPWTIPIDNHHHHHQQPVQETVQQIGKHNNHHHPNHNNKDDATFQHAKDQHQRGDEQQRCLWTLQQDLPIAIKPKTTQDNAVGSLPRIWHHFVLSAIRKSHSFCSTSRWRQHWQ